MATVVQARIDENRKTRNPILDLAGCSLAEFPVEVCDFEWLKDLRLGFEGTTEQSRNSFGRIPNGIASLTALESLDLGGTGITDLRPLASLTTLQSLDIGGTPVNDLGPLASLTALQSLDLGRTLVSRLRPLASLTALQSLYIGGTPVDDLGPLAELTALQSLDLQSLPVSDLWPLAGLKALQSLVLRDTKVSDIRPLAALTALQTLDLGDTNVGYLSPLASLKALQSLDLDRTNVVDIKPLASLEALQSLDLDRTKVRDIRPLATLTSLLSLKLGGTEVRDISPLATLTSLKSLDLDGLVVSDFWPLASLASLTSLDLGRTRIWDLRPLTSLISLESLDLESTAVTDLRPLASLTSLRFLDLRRTRVTDLSPLLGLFRSGVRPRWDQTAFTQDGVLVFGCPLTSPPPEVIEQGRDAVLSYFHEIEEQGVDHLYEAKLLLVGEGGAGKTSLFRRLYRPDLELPSDDETTRGIDIHAHQFVTEDGRPFRLNIWDFGGQQIYHATHQFFLTRRSLYILVDDTRTNSRTVHDEGFKYWLRAIELLSDHSPVLVFQNEKGARTKDIDQAGIKARFPNVLKVLSGDLERLDAADAIRREVEHEAQQLPHIGEELPRGWLDVRAAIEERAQRVPYISEQEYLEVYAKYLGDDRERARFLSRYFHDLGVFLHFQDDELLRRTVVLQNRWATDAVFRILDHEPTKRRGGRFTREDYESLWSDRQYQDKQIELVTLMEKFELCYRLQDEIPTTWLAPRLLPASRPEALLDLEGGGLALRYRYEFLPDGLVNRLQVRLNRFVRRPELCWSTGALFEARESGLVAEVAANGQEITLRSRGPRRNELLKVVASELEALHDSFPGLRARVSKWIPCVCDTCAVSLEPYLFEESSLVRRCESGRDTVECDFSYANVNVVELLEGITREELRRLRGDDFRRAEPTVSHLTFEPAASARRTISVFVASSDELIADRDAFELYFRQRNDDFLEDGVYLQIVRWENLLGAMSQTRLQDEYNNEVRSSDVFVSLVATRTGRYTEEEFDTAYNAFVESGKPHIFTFVKRTEVDLASADPDDSGSLWAFINKLKGLGHYPTRYTDSENLKLQFGDQLRILIRQKRI